MRYHVIVFLAFIKCIHLSRKGNNDDDAEMFACLLYVIEEKVVKDIADAMHRVVVTTKRDLVASNPRHRVFRVFSRSHLHIVMSNFEQIMVPV